MKRLLKTIVALTMAGAVVYVGWRYLARRRSVPCPPWLIWLLENRFSEAFFGSVLQLNRAGIAPGMRVLDAGCGPGRLTIPAAERVGPQGEVVALDIQPAMLNMLKQRLAQRGLTNVRTILGGLGQDLLERDAFDRALLVTVLGEVPDRVGALREIYAALKPGGTLSVMEALPDPHYQSQESVRRLTEAAGFRLERTYGNTFVYTMNAMCNFI